MYKRQDYEDEDEDEEESQEVQAEKDDGQEGGSSGGMSNLEKALLATELAMVGKKLHGFVQGRKNGSGVEDQSTMTMKNEECRRSCEECWRSCEDGWERVLSACWR